MPGILVCISVLIQPLVDPDISQYHFSEKADGTLVIRLTEPQFSILM